MSFYSERTDTSVSGGQGMYGGVRGALRPILGRSHLLDYS